MSKPESMRTLTVWGAVNLGNVVRAAQQNKRVAWILNGSGDVITGTARSIGDVQGNFASETDDVRDCFLRITTDAGWEHFMPIKEVLDRVADMEMSLDYS